MGPSSGPLGPCSKSVPLLAPAVPKPELEFARTKMGRRSQTPFA